MSRTLLRRFSLNRFFLFTIIAFILGSILGAAPAVFDFQKLHPEQLLQIISEAATSTQATICLALLYFACLLCGMSPLFYPLFYTGMFLSAFSMSFCSALFLSAFSSAGCLLCAWFFLPRLLLLSYSGFYLAQCRTNEKPAAHMPLYILGMLLILTLQHLLFPLFIAPLLQLL